MIKKLTVMALVGVIGLSSQAEEGGRGCPKNGDGFGPGKGGPRHGGKEMMGKIFSKLDLSEEQKEEIKSIKEAMKETFESNKDEMKALYEAQKEIASADVFDEAAFRANHKQISEMKEDLTVDQVLLKKQIHSLLSDDQQAQLKEMVTQMKEKGTKRGKGGEGRKRGEAHGQKCKGNQAGSTE